MRVYISGKISGLDIEEVRKSFLEAENHLKEMGLEPVNPLNNGLATDDDWIDHIISDLKTLSTCNAIYLLDKWEGSCGATIEVIAARKLGLKIMGCYKY